MLARVRARLTYANVVATLALFVALGGSAYAVNQIGSKDIKNRSIKRVDVRKNALTGKEIAESRLRRVPTAQQALEATLAQTAQIAQQATTALSAEEANLAKNSEALGGESQAFFEKSSRTQFGSAPVGPAGESGEQVVLSWPAMGVELTSATNQGACGGDLRIAVRNTKTSGPGVEVFEQGLSGSVAANDKDYFCGTTGASEFDAELTDSTGRALFADCLVANGELRCIAVRSEP